MRWTALVMAAWLSGCSFAFVSGPPENHEQLPYFTCSESRVVPVLDTLFAILEGANLALASSQSDQQWADNFGGNPPIARKTSIPLYAVLTLLGVSGAYYGFTRTSACRDARERWVTRQNGTNLNQPAGAWPPPPPPPTGAPGAAPPPPPAPPPAPDPNAPAPQPAPYVPPPAPGQ